MNVVVGQNTIHQMKGKTESPFTHAAYHFTFDEDQQ